MDRTSKGGNMTEQQKTVLNTYSVNGCALTLSHVRSDGLDYYLAEIAIVLDYKQDILEPSENVFYASSNSRKDALQRLSNTITQVCRAFTATGDFRNSKRLMRLPTEMLSLAGSLPYSESRSPSTAA